MRRAAVRPTPPSCNCSSGPLLLVLLLAVVLFLLLFLGLKVEGRRRLLPRLLPRRPRRPCIIAHTAAGCHPRPRGGGWLAWTHGGGSGGVGTSLHVEQRNRRRPEDEGSTVSLVSLVRLVSTVSLAQ
eukprot:scaffold88267_cov66-Phaeocystis_antarctica.AAC.2